MFECLIIGDSIASEFSKFAPECQNVVNYNSTTRDWIERYQFNPFYRDTIFKTIVVGIGSNDLSADKDSLRRMRTGMRGDLIIWLLPNSESKIEQRRAIVEVAEEYGDRTLDMTDIASYKTLIDNIFNR